MNLKSEYYRFGADRWLAGDEPLPVRGGGRPGMTFAGNGQGSPARRAIWLASSPEPAVAGRMCPGSTGGEIGNSGKNRSCAERRTLSPTSAPQSRLQQASPAPPPAAIMLAATPWPGRRPPDWRGDPFLFQNAVYLLTPAEETPGPGPCPSGAACWRYTLFPPAGRTRPDGGGRQSPAASGRRRAGQPPAGWSRNARTLSHGAGAVTRPGCPGLPGPLAGDLPLQPRAVVAGIIGFP